MQYRRRLHNLFFLSRNKTKNWIQRCALCAQHKASHLAPVGRLVHIDAGQPGGVVHVDYYGPLPLSASGNRYVLAFSDHFTGWVEAVATPTADADTFVRLFFSEWGAHYGMPHTIITDRGSHFMAELAQRFLDAFGIRHSPTTAYHQQANGKVERFLQTFGSALAATINGATDKWDLALPTILLSYRSTATATTGVSPALAFLGRELVLPGDALVGLVPSASTSVNEHIDNLRTSLQHRYDEMRQMMEERNIATAARYNASHRAPPMYEIDSLVWLEDMTRAGKFDPKFTGPHRVLAVLSPLTVEIQDEYNQRHKQIVHVKRLKAYKSVTDDLVPAGDAAISSIRASRIDNDGTLQYLVRWAGFTRRYDSWVAATDVHAPELVAAFERLQPAALPRSSAVFSGGMSSGPLSDDSAGAESLDVNVNMSVLTAGAEGANQFVDLDLSVAHSEVAHSINNNVMLDSQLRVDGEHVEPFTLLAPVTDDGEVDSVLRRSNRPSKPNRKYLSVHTLGVEPQVYNDDGWWFRRSEIDWCNSQQSHTHNIECHDVVPCQRNESSLIYKHDSVNGNEYSIACDSTMVDCHSGTECRFVNKPEVGLLNRMKYSSCVCSFRNNDGSKLNSLFTPINLNSILSGETLIG